MRLVVAEDKYQLAPADMDALFGRALSAPECCVVLWGNPVFARMALEDGATCSEPAYAFVAQGRWSVACECRSSQYASKQDRRFFCVECGNAVQRGRWRPVVFPDNADQIERALLSRPLVRTRNWRPGESIDGLATENREHGVVVA